MKHTLLILLMLGILTLVAACSDTVAEVTASNGTAVTVTPTTANSSKLPQTTTPPLTTPQVTVPTTTAHGTAKPFATSQTTVPPVTATQSMTTTKPITTPQPVTTTKPITTAKPITTTKPVPTTKPITTTVPVTTEKPVTTAPVTYTPENFMIAIPDSTPLSSLVLPGTHDSGATHDMIVSGTAKCQSLSIADQLKAGVRYLDIRLRRQNGSLAVYHGEVDQKLTFDSVLEAVYAFLEQNPSETLIMCIKEEADATGTDNDAFDTMVKAYINRAASRWYTQNKIPTLGEVRGKIVLMRRFTASGELGFNASSGWSDNTTFTLHSGGYHLAVQDYYNNESAEKKWEAVESFCNTMQHPAANTYYLNNTSGYKSGVFGIPNINTIANSVNPKLLTYLESAKGIVGIIATDFMTAELAQAILTLNFR